MKARVVLLWTCISALPAAVIQVACGGEDTGGAAKADSGEASNDAASDGSRDAAKPKPDAGGDDDDDDNCDKTADFTKNIPDASIADGASSTGACVACTNAKCKTFVKACNENCICQGVAGDALTCFLDHPGDIYTMIAACADKLGDSLGDKDAQNAALGVVTCVNSQCKEECPFLPPDAGPDAN